MTKQQNSLDSVNSTSPHQLPFDMKGEKMSESNKPATNAKAAELLAQLANTPDFTELVGSGRRNSTTHPVRILCRESSNKSRYELNFLFSEEVVQMVGWQQGDKLSAKRSSDGENLYFFPTEKGRTFSRKNRCFEMSLKKNKHKQTNDFFGFDIKQDHRWTVYSVEGAIVILKMADMDK